MNQYPPRRWEKSRPAGELPDDRRGSIALLPVVILPILAMAASITTPLWPAWQSRFQFGPGMATVLFALYVYALVPSSTLAPRARDRLGTKSLVLGGVLFALAGNLLLWFGDSIAALAAARLIQGIGIGFASGPLSGALLATVARADRPTMARKIAVVLTAGAGAGPVVSGLLAGEEGSSPGALFAVMTVLLILALFGAFEVRGAEHAIAHTLESHSRRGRRIPPGAPVSLLAWAIAYTVLAASPGFARELLDSDRPLVIGAPAGLLLFASAAVQVVPPGPSKRSAMRMGAALMLPGLIAFAAVVWIPSLWLMSAALITIGVGHGRAFPAALQAASAAADRNSTSRFFAVTYAGGVVPVLAVGVLATLTNIVTAMTIFAIGAGIACCLAALRLGGR